MNFELHVLYEEEDDRPVPVNDLRITVNKHARLGWDGIVLTRNVDTATKLPPLPNPLRLSAETEAIVARRYGMCVMGDYLPFPQYTRLNLVTDEISELRSLLRNTQNMMYDMLSVTPLNDDVFREVCATADVDLITIDPTKYLPRKCWKELKAAVNRDVAIEFLYSGFLGDDHTLRTMIAACQSVFLATKGRKSMNRVILLSLGTSSSDCVRSPADVRSFARMVGIPHPEKMTSESAKRVLAKGLARRTHAGVVRRLRDPKPEDDDEIEIKITETTLGTF